MLQIRRFEKEERDVAGKIEGEEKEWKSWGRSYRNLFSFKRKEGSQRACRFSLLCEISKTLILDQNKHAIIASLQIVWGRFKDFAEVVIQEHTELTELSINVNVTPFSEQISLSFCSFALFHPRSPLQNPGTFNLRRVRATTHQETRNESLILWGSEENYIPKIPELPSYVEKPCVTFSQRRTTTLKNEPVLDGRRER